MSTETKKPITLTTLKEVVDRYLEMKPGRELTVCIPNNKGGMGGTSVTHVMGANGGIDWDAGKFFIYPMVKMIERPPDFTESDYQKALQQIESLKTALSGLIHEVENNTQFVPVKIRFCKRVLEIFNKNKLPK